MGEIRATTPIPQNYVSFPLGFPGFYRRSARPPGYTLPEECCHRQRKPNGIDEE
jgi:hypothetical protein